MLLAMRHVQYEQRIYRISSVFIMAAVPALSSAANAKFTLPLPKNRF